MSLKDTALEYTEKFGWSVFPLRAKGKEPVTKRGVLDATTDADIIEAWWQKWPNANVAIACGPSKLVVVDIDPGKGGEESWNDLNISDDTITSLTGGGGQHLIYAAPDGADIRNSAGKLGPGLDVRASGGYVVAPPSIHPSGRPYVWEVNAHPEDREPATLPEALKALLVDGKMKAAPPLPDRIPTGERNTTLTSLAGSMRRRGASEAAILAALVEENSRCNPPLDQNELENIAKSIAGYTPAPQEAAFAVTNKQVLDAIGAAASPAHNTDMGNATRLIARHGTDLRYCHAWKTWLVWDGQRWQKDATAEIARRGKDTVRNIYAEAAEGKDEDARKATAQWAMRSEANKYIKNMIELAQSEPGIPVEPNDLDPNPWLFNCLNGTLDLKTGELREHNRTDLITKMAPVEFDPNAKLPLWDRFLRDATDDDQELINFLQRSVGYTLTGDTSEEVLYFVHGPTIAGKSTFVEAIKSTLGDYATTADFESFLQRRFIGGPRPDLARLAGARFVASVEVAEGKRLAEGLIKLLTGGDTVTTRFLFSKEFEYIPQFKLWLAANASPKIKDDDDATWRRILRLPFDHTVEKPNPLVKSTLRNPEIAGPAILAWAVKGCLNWQRDGLNVPARVTKATEALRGEMNPLQDFFAEHCKFRPDYWIPVTELWQTYKTWGAEQGLNEKDLIRGKKWGSRLRAKGCDQKRQTIEGVRIKGWSGITLQDEPENYPIPGFEPTDEIGPELAPNDELAPYFGELPKLFTTGSPIGEPLANDENTGPKTEYGANLFTATEPEGKKTTASVPVGKAQIDESLIQEELDRDPASGLAAAKDRARTRTPQNEALDPPPTTACFACQGTKYWRRPSGEWVCAKCHPPGDDTVELICIGQKEE